MVVGPEFHLHPGEAPEMAQAILDVAKHYPVRGLDDKMIAWFNLSQIVVIGYGSRIMAVRARHAAERGKMVRPQQAPPTMAPSPSARAGVQEANGVVQPEMKPAQPLPADARTGEIAGVGNIEFPEGHPLFAGGTTRKH